MIKNKQILSGLFAALMSCSFSSLTMAYTEEDERNARIEATSKAPLAKRLKIDPDLAARILYYKETLDHLTEVKDMGYENFTHTIEYNWDITNIAVLNSTTISEENFTEVIDDAISLYSYLLNNP